MTLGKAEKKSISLPKGLVELINKNCGEVTLSKWLQGAAMNRLEEEGVIVSDEIHQLIELLKETANQCGVDDVRKELVNLQRKKARAV